MVQTIIKIILLGDSGVGKTSLLRHFSAGRPDPGIHKTRPTVGLDFVTKTISLGPRIQIRLQIWDTAGQERYQSLAGHVFRGVDGVGLVCDSNRPDSLQKCLEWRDTFIKRADPEEPQQFPFFIFANKAERGNWRDSLVIESPLFSYPFLATSALTGFNVAKAFELLAREAWRYHSRRQRAALQEPRPTLALTGSEEDPDNAYCWGSVSLGCPY